MLVPHVVSVPESVTLESVLAQKNAMLPRLVRLEGSLTSLML